MPPINYLEANHAAICRNLTDYLKNHASAIDPQFSFDRERRTLAGSYRFDSSSRIHQVTYQSNDYPTKKEFLDRFNLDLAANYIFDRQPQAAYKYYFSEHALDHIEITIALGDSIVTTETKNADQVKKIYDFATGKLNVSAVEFLIEQKLWEELEMEPQKQPDRFLQLPFVQFPNLV